MKRKYLEEQLDKANKKIDALTSKINTLSWLVENPDKFKLYTSVEVNSRNTHCLGNFYGTYGNCTSTTNNFPFYYTLDILFVNSKTFAVETEKLLCTDKGEITITNSDFDYNTGDISIQMHISNEYYKITMNLYQIEATLVVCMLKGLEWIKLPIVSNSARNKRFII